MRLLLDINVVLDVVLAREPWWRDAASVLGAIETGQAAGCVAGHTVTTIHYLVARAAGRPAADMAVADLLRLVDVVPVEQVDFLEALGRGARDFEDAVQAVCAMKSGADFIVTRNQSDFGGQPIPAILPGALLSRLAPVMDKTASAPAPGRSES